MSVKNLLDTAMYSKLSGGTALTNALGGTAIYSSFARGTSGTISPRLPYVVFSQAAGGPDNITPSDSRQQVYWVRAYAASEAQAGTIDALVSNLLHKGTLSVSGYVNAGVMRENEIQVYEVKPNGALVYTAGAYYRIWLDQ